MKVEIKGAESTIKSITSIYDQKAIDRALNLACIQVENTARENCPADSGELRRSITHEVEDNTGIVGTNVLYAPYVELGTGVFAKNGDGKQGYWVFVKGSTYTSEQKSNKVYTLDEAKKIVAIMRSKGLEAYYTNGQHPQPYLEPALNSNREIIMDIFEAVLKGSKNA